MEDETAPATISHQKVRIQGDSRLNRAEILLAGIEFKAGGSINICRRDRGDDARTNREVKDCNNRLEDPGGSRSFDWEA
jgi:hypothetical protein